LYFLPGTVGDCHSRESFKSIRKCHCEACFLGRSNLIFFAFFFLIFAFFYAILFPLTKEKHLRIYIKKTPALSASTG